MPDACECVDGHEIDCSTLLRYRFPPPPGGLICRYRDNVRRFFHDAFLRAAVFFVAIYCIFSHFDYLEMRAKGKLSRWFLVPGWKVLRKDKDGHELGGIEQLYEPVEEHRRAAIEALMDRNYEDDDQSRSQSPTFSDTPQDNLVGQRDTTQEGTSGVLRIPPGTTQEALAAAQELLNYIHKVNIAKNAEASDETCDPHPSHPQQVGPSRIDMRPSPPSEAFSQYSIHPDSPEPSERNSMPITTVSQMREMKLPPQSSRPLRKFRSFRVSDHSQGYTVWMTTASYEDLAHPPEPDPEDEPGVLYIHWNLTDNTVQIWLLGEGPEKQWAITQLDATKAIPHPKFMDRYLVLRMDGTPSWVIFSTWKVVMKRWANGRSQD